MSGFGDAVSRRRAREERRDGRTAPSADGPELTVEEADGVIVIRSAYEAPPATGGLPWRSLGGEPGSLTVLAGSVAVGTPAVWTHLAEVLDTAVDTGIHTVRLALSGAAAPRTGGRAPLAQQIAEHWEVDVIAAVGEVVVVPDGSLFAYGGGELPFPAAWHRFRPRAATELLGPRDPAPFWQSAFNRLSQNAPADCFVDRVPAGVVVRSAQGTRPRPDDLAFAVPCDEEHPIVLVGSGRGEEVFPDVIAGVLAFLPGPVRDAVRLAPGSHRDILPVAQEVAEILGTQVEALTGLPLVAPDGDDTTGPVITMTDRSGGPTWLPAVGGVSCQPTAPDMDHPPSPVPTLLRSPMPGVPPSGVGVIDLCERWRLTLTRSGAVLEPRDGPLGHAADEPVDADRFVLRTGPWGAESVPSLLRVCETLLANFDPLLRPYTELRAEGATGSALRDVTRLAVRHGVSLKSVPLGPDRTVLVPITAPPPVSAGPGTGPGISPPFRPAADRSSAAGLPRRVPGQSGFGVGTHSTTPAPAVPGLQDAVGAATSRSGTGGRERRNVPGPPAVRRSLASSPLSLTPATDRDRNAFRQLVGTCWDRHMAAVARALTLTPTLRGTNAEQAVCDLVAAHLYLTADVDSPFAPKRLDGALRTGDTTLLPYAVCLSAGLRRLPSYRGIAVRDGDGVPASGEDAVLQTFVPVGAVPLSQAATLPKVGYAFRSLTARRVHLLLGRADTATGPAELLLFPPGTAFDVLGTQSGAAGVLLFKERTSDSQTDDSATRLGALERMRSALQEALQPAGVPQEGQADWLRHCQGPVW